jgi:hypothetical protein
MLARRAFLAGLAALPILSLLPVRRARAALTEEARKLLPTSRFVYVSPLRKDGSESSCHGELWYTWMDGKVVVITPRKMWKGRAVDRGLDRARIWVGDHGRWKGTLGMKNEEFRKAPTFDARARVLDGPALIERLLTDYAKKYPDEIGTWRQRFRDGIASGERVLIGYEPL